MVFSSLTFLYIFLPIVLIGYYIVPEKLKNLFILLSGLLFYAWGEPFYVFVLVLSTMIDYTAGLLIDRFRGKNILPKVFLLVSLIMNLSLLGTFKYSGFIVENINAILHTSIANPNLPLPIGISFFTFQSMSYTIDMYRGKIKVQKNPITFAAFVTLFPQIVAGPIVRYEDIEKELNHRVIKSEDVYQGILRFITGLSKKVLIANNIGGLWASAKALEFGDMSVLTAWLGAIAFTLQIYFDFSGYSDMAIGLGKMMGFTFPENFDYPYLSKSVAEFWRRWHMTLSNWFKSYVYFPLGGSKKGLARTILNLAIVWLLTGIWHGARWNFIVWGCAYGVLIILERLFLGKWLSKIPAVFSWIYTMFFVTLGWVIFDTSSLKEAFLYMANMFGHSGMFMDHQAIYLLINYGVILVIAIFASTDLLKRMVEFVKTKNETVVGIGTVVFKVCCLMLSTIYLIDASYNPFLYFNF